ncbi:nitrate reductase molybdenum cofactor assembly chaperone [Streptomyces thermocarboxydus]
MSPRRARRRAPDTPVLHRIAAVLLRYPDEAMLTCLDDITAALPAILTPADRTRLTAACDHLRRLPPTEAAERYVETFDHTRRRSLHLTYYRHGDTRARGMALLTLKHTYRQVPRTTRVGAARLPAADPGVRSSRPESGHRVLLQCQAYLELLRQGLHEHSEPYAGILDALCGRLPQPARRERDAWRRLATEGPPDEHVGLEPFGPPEQTGLDPRAASGGGVASYPTVVSAKEGR